jgi:hypothetical protein
MAKFFRQIMSKSPYMALLCSSQKETGGNVPAAAIVNDDKA